MQMPNDIAKWLQNELTGLNHEDWGLVYLLTGNLGSIPLGTPARWQLGVDVIYRLLLCDMVSVDDLSGNIDQKTVLHTIQTSDPYADGAGYWHATLIWGTQHLSELIDSHLPPDSAPNSELVPSFIDALEQLFAENGVPWSDKPLLPIMLADTERSAPR